MRNSHILALTTVAALASSFLVPSDAFAGGRGFAHAAQASRTARAPTASVRTASVGFQRSTGLQHQASSGRVASTSFTQPHLGSARTAGSHSPFASRFSHTGTSTGTTGLNHGSTTAPNTKLALRPDDRHDHAMPSTSARGSGSNRASCFLNQGKGVRRQPTTSLRRRQLPLRRRRQPPLRRPLVVPTSAQGSGLRRPASSTRARVSAAPTTSLRRRQLPLRRPLVVPTSARGSGPRRPASSIRARASPAPTTSRRQLPLRRPRVILATRAASRRIQSPARRPMSRRPRGPATRPPATSNRPLRPLRPLRRLTTTAARPRAAEITRVRSPANSPA